MLYLLLIPVAIYSWVYMKDQSGYPRTHRTIPEAELVIEAFSVLGIYFSMYYILNIFVG